MRLKLFFITIATILCCSISQTIFAADASNNADSAIMNFYRNPNYDDFINATTTMIEQTNDFMIYDFTTMVIDKHPDYVNKIVKSFKNYSENEKILLFTSLTLTNNTDAINTIKKSHQIYKAEVAAHSPEAIKSVAINDDPGVIDSLWMAYSATGDDRYPMTILKYINNDDFLLIMGYEMLNRSSLNELTSSMGFNNNKPFDLSDLKAAIKKRYPNNSDKMFVRAVVISQAIRSYDTHRNMDPAFQTKYEAIVKKDPKLDYWKKINRAIGNN